jgi:glycosyltransferase involved in cell wall biosynthesis
MAEPRVTLGFTTYNNGRYLAGAFDNVLAQDFRDFEVVVCDNGSTDRTLEICEQYALSDSRFRIYRNEGNIGLAGSWKRVVSLARGELFRYTSHDDRMATTLLSRCVSALDADPKAVLAYPRGLLIDEDDNEFLRCQGEPEILGSTPARRVAESMEALNYCNALFGVIRTDVLRRTGLVRPLSAGENPLLIELAARGRFRLIDDFLFYRRDNPSVAMSASKDSVSERRDWINGSAPARPSHRRRRSEAPLIAKETVLALLHSELPVGSRLSAVATFGVVWPLRMARIRAGMLRARMFASARAAA